MNLDPHGLVAAAQANDLDGIRSAALQGATMLDADDQRHTALWYAAEAGRTETVQTLLDALPVHDLVAEQAHISACAAEARRGGHAKALEVLSETGAIDEPSWTRIHEVARGPALAAVDQRMAMPTRLVPSGDLADQRTAEVREAYRMEAWHAQQAGMQQLMM